MTDKQIPVAAEPPVSEPAFVAETLAWCNEKRAERGGVALARLPRGTRKVGGSCPCGKATGLWVGQSHYARNGGARTRLDIPLPLPVKQFVRAFDGGELPQYDASTQSALPTPAPDLDGAA